MYYQMETSATSKLRQYKKISVKGKSLKRLLGFLEQRQRRGIIGIDTQKAGIRLSRDVVSFCKANGFSVLGTQIYF